MGSLDEMLNGLHRGRLYVIAARPAMGKTTLVQNMAANAALRLGRKVLFASLETGESELAQRHLAAESGVAHQRLERAQLRGSPSASHADTSAIIAMLRQMLQRVADVAASVQRDAGGSVSTYMARRGRRRH